MKSTVNDLDISFILPASGPCYVLLAYPKQPCVYLKANMHCAHCITSFFYALFLYHMTNPNPQFYK